MSELISDYDFDLPNELIAQEPSEKRSDAKLLIVRRNPLAGQNRFEDLLVKDLPEFISGEKNLAASRWFRNRSKVFPARFYAKRPSGSRHEIVLVEPSDESSTLWKAIIRNSRRFTYPEKLIVESGSRVSPEITVVSEGRVDLSSLGPSPLESLEEFGEMPLPPYIQNRDQTRDRERYQSVWAQPEHWGSAAAPTASLHFDEKTIAALEKRISFHDLILHVGLGTFEALRFEKVSENRLHAERIRVPQSSAEALVAKKPPFNVAIGSTALRTMESFMLNQEGSNDVDLKRQSNGDYCGRSSIFIRPGYQFLATDALFTNFHLPRSSLFIMLATFAGSTQLAQEAYRHAIEKKYRFFSYGDASFWI